MLRYRLAALRIRMEEPTMSAAPKKPQPPQHIVPEPELEEVEKAPPRRPKWDPSIGAVVGESPEFEKARRPARPERMS